METQAWLRGEYFGHLRVAWDLAPQQAEVKVHTRWLILILALTLLALAVSLILLTRVIVVRPIRIVHQSLQTEAAPAAKLRYAARELQRLGEAVAALLRLKQEIKRSEVRYRGLFDHISTGCMVLSRSEDGFRVEDINESCRLLPVLAAGGCAPRRLGAFLAEQEAAILYEALRNAAATRQPGHIEEFALTRGGHDYWLDFQVFSLDSGELVLMIRDVTEKKISHDLRRAKEAAEQANELKSAFLASMSHEIRTPLNGVLSMVELLRGTRLNNKQQHWVNAIRSSGQVLLSTINDILDFTRIEAGRLRLEEIRFSLGEVIGNLLNATSQRAYGKGLELVLHQAPGLPDQLIGDPFRLQQILINLVGNAVKFTEHGEVEIVLEMQEISSDRLLLCVSVRDTGIGIAPEQIERVFLPFEQGVTNRFPFSEGTGLGLPISKRLVQAMGGDIAVESSPGEGSVFLVEVPVGVAPGPRGNDWLLPDGWCRCPALVWVLHAAVRESVVRTLDSFGFSTRAVSSAAEAAGWTGGLEQHSCLAVLDDSLLGGEGSDSLRDLKAQAGTSRLFVLYLVNMFNRDKGELDRIAELPDTAYVMKPVHASSLFNALQELFEFSAESRTVAPKMEDLSWEMLVDRLGARERLSGARILLVEDNLVNREVAVEALSMAGIEVQVAVDGQAAVDMVHAGPTFDAVLMDLQMPVMDGFQATQIIRRQYPMNALPIIAMTAGVLFKDRQRSLDVGMNDHVGKPVNLRNLMETLMKWVHPANPRPPAAASSHAGVLPEMDLADALWSDPERIELPGIKVSKGLNRLGGNRKLYFKLLKSFAKAHEHSAAEILSALSEGDAKTLRRLAHTLKGVATTLGAEVLHEAATTLERDAADGTLDAVRAAVEPLAQHLNEVLESIRTLLQSPRAAGGDEPAAVPQHNGADGTALRGEILDLLDRSDTRLQELCTANKAAVQAWFGAQAPFETFMEEIEHYRFEQARDTLLRFAERLRPGRAAGAGAAE